MKIREAIERIDSLKHNTYSRAEKISWLSLLDSRVKRLILDTHEGFEDTEFTGYNDDTDPETEMLIPSPFEEVYMRWLECQIDYHNGEIDRYNNSVLMYQEAYDSFARFVNRNYMPKSTAIRYF